MAEQEVVVELLVPVVELLVLEAPEVGEVPEDEEELEDDRWVAPRVVVRLKVVVVWCCHRCRGEELELQS